MHVDVISMMMPELTEIIGGLINLGTTESARKVQKKDRATQKSAFRDILVTLEQFPESHHADFGGSFELQFRGDTLHVQSWSQLKCVQHLRTIFGEGLQSQVISGNAVVRELLGLSPMRELHPSTGELTREEKRAMLEEQDFMKKARGQRIQKHRSDKRNQRDAWEAE